MQSICLYSLLCYVNHHFYFDTLPRKLLGLNFTTDVVCINFFRTETECRNQERAGQFKNKEEESPCFY